MSDDIDDLRETRRHVFRSSVDASTKLVALALLDHWSRATDTFPSVLRLASWTSLNRTTVIRCLGTLEELGGILVTRRNGASNRYALGQLSLLPVAPCDQSDNATGRTSRPRPVAPRDQTSRTTRPEVSQEVSQQESQGEARAPLRKPRKPREPAEQGRVAKWRRVPQAWAPNAAHSELASECRVNLDTELAKFRDHEFKAPKTDADAAFRTWLRNAQEFGGSRGVIVQRGGTIRESAPSLDDDTGGYGASKDWA